jgi:hypothetical protein
LRGILRQAAEDDPIGHRIDFGHELGERRRRDLVMQPRELADGRSENACLPLNIS